MRNIIKVPKNSRERFLPLELDDLSALSKAGVILSGISELTDGYKISYRNFEYILVIATVEGRGAFKSRGIELELNPDSILTTSAQNEIEFSCCSNWHIVWFYLQPLPKWSSVKQSAAQVHSHPSLVQRLRHSMDGLLLETGWVQTQSICTPGGWVPLTRPNEQSRSGLPLNASSHYAGLILLYLEKICGGKAITDPGSQSLEYLWMEVYQSPEKPWNLKDMVKLAGVSPASLNRHVAKLYSITPKQMVIRIKMKVACRLLSETQYPLQQIAERVGCADQFIFSAAFRKTVGMPPSKYRKSRTSTAV